MTGSDGIIAIRLYTTTYVAGSAIRDSHIASVRTRSSSGSGATWSEVVTVPGGGSTSLRIINSTTDTTCAEAATMNIPAGQYSISAPLTARPTPFTPAQTRL